MGKSVNKAIIIGTLGRDPEMRQMPNGNQVVNISIATDEGYNDKSTGQKVEHTEWHRVTAYGKLAEIIGKYVKKGSKVFIEGKLKTRKWEKDGIERFSTEIVASDMTMLGGADSNNQQQPTQNNRQQQQTPNQAQGLAPPQQSNNFPNDFDDDIPF
jgi:single-strand DNA-binding protein